MIKKDNKQSDSIQAEALGRVAVLMGGDSAERDVSLKSGKVLMPLLLICVLRIMLRTAVSVSN
jgi:D-alanine-D-alanine ligase